MKYNRAKAEAEYKKEWQKMKLEMRKKGMSRKSIKLASKACRQALNNDRRYYDNTFTPSNEKMPDEADAYSFDRLIQDCHSYIPEDPYEKVCSLEAQIEDSRLWHWTQRLSGREREVVMLLWEEYTTSEISVLLRISKQGVRNRLRAAKRAKCRRHLARRNQPVQNVLGIPKKPCKPETDAQPS